MSTPFKTLPALISFAVLFLTLSCSDKEKEPVKDQSEEINAWFDTKHEEMLQMSPLRLTFLGRKEQYDKIDDLSEAAEDRMIEWYGQTAEELQQKFDYENLNMMDRTSYDLWMYQYNQLKEGIKFRNLGYVFTQMSGLHAQMPNILINFHKVDSLSDMQAYISRIAESGRAMEQLVARAEKQSDAGIRPPRFTFETVLVQSKAIINGKPFTDAESGSPLWNDMNTKIDALLQSGEIDEEMATSLKEDSENALTTHFKPAYDKLVAWLEREMPNAEATPTGISRHPNGDAYYNYLLKVSTTTDLTADEIHKIGLEEVDRLQQEMIEIKNQVGFEGSLQEFFKFINTDEQFFFPNTDEGRQGYLDESTRFLDDITEKLPEYFGILPKAGLEVKRVESFREQAGAPQHYFPGTPDGSRGGTYYVHLLDMASMPKTTLEGVAYHEGNPGHHMQISIAQELESVPEFRTQGSYTAYVEGWALYSELLAKEMGGYENPYYDFGRLVNEIWRAIRLVVDTGLHAKGWTEEDAINYFAENSSISPGAIKAEVQRYMIMPGQATAYKIGMIKIQELRAKAEQELGDAFDIREFHDVILGGGAMPLELLERNVNYWLANKKTQSQLQ